MLSIHEKYTPSLGDSTFEQPPELSRVTMNSSQLFMPQGSFPLCHERGDLVGHRIDWGARTLSSVLAQTFFKLFRFRVMDWLGGELGYPQISGLSDNLGDGFSSLFNLCSRSEGVNVLERGHDILLIALPVSFVE